MHTSWHVPDDELHRYAEGTSVPPWRWSTEAHLGACASCRDRLAAAVDPDLLANGWASLEAELEAPVPGPMESLLIRVGVADHTARLLAATPLLRASWLGAVALTLALTAVVADIMNATSAPWLFLAVVPVLPLVGVAVSFGPGVDPTYEMSVVSPYHMLRLLMVRCIAVLGTTSVMSAAATLVLPEYGLVALGWFLPALALTALSLALTPRIGPVGATVAVGLAWLTLAASSVRVVLFGPAGQVMLAACAVVTAGVVVRLRRRFDSTIVNWTLAVRRGGPR